MRAAVLSALERPGMPHRRRCVGTSFTSSNSTLAFSNRGSSYFSPVSALQPQFRHSMSLFLRLFDQNRLLETEVNEASLLDLI